MFFLAFCIYPLIYGIVMSLFKYNIADPSQNEWRGLGNFITLLFLEPLKPRLPADDQLIALPWVSVTVTNVLLKED